MKNILSLLIACFTLIFMIGCSSDDPKDNGEKAGECACKILELESEIIELEEDLLKTYEKVLVKEKNPDYDPKDKDKRGEPEYIWVKEVDDWDDHVRIQKEIHDKSLEVLELYIESAKYGMKGFSAEKEGDYKDWLEDFDEEGEDYIDDNCEDLEEENEKEQEKLWDKEDKYFEDVDDDDWDDDDWDDDDWDDDDWGDDDWN